MATFLDVDLTVPEGIGTVKRVERCESETGVVLVQDAHANYTAQMNWARILKHFHEKYGWDLVCVEGGSRNDSLAYMREYAHPEKRRKVADEFLRAGKISGENYVDLVYDYPIEVWGVERPENYDAHMASFTKVNELRGELVAAIREPEELVHRIMVDRCGAELAELSALQASVQSGDVPLASYYASLAVIANLHEIEIDPAAFPNFATFNRVSSLEKEIDFKHVESE